MHLETFLLDLMTAENRQQTVLSQKLLNRFLTKVVGAVTLWVLFEVTMDGLFVVHRVSPHQVTEYTIEGNLLLAIDLINLIELLQAR